MRNLVREVDNNFTTFSAAWRTELDTVRAELQLSEDRFRKSYRRMVSLQAWRATVLDGALSTGSMGFYLEAQNDILVSHTHAQLGSWRSTLKALRSALENIVYCLYYMDHPIELQLWETGDHKLGFTEGLNYLQKHPKLRNHTAALYGHDIMVREYATLSRAVHASAKSFRMTAAGQYPSIWSSDNASLGAWTTREAAVISAINLLLVSLFAAEIQGARQPNLRNAISLAIPAAKHALIRTELHVNLSRVPPGI